MDHHLVSPLTVDVSLWPFQQNCSLASSKTLPETKSFHTPENWCTKGRCIHIIYITLKNRPFFGGVCTVTVGVSKEGWNFRCAVATFMNPVFPTIGLAILDHTGVGQVHGRETPRISDGWVEKRPKCWWPQPMGRLWPFAIFTSNLTELTHPQVGGFSPISLQICRPKSCLSSPMFQCFSARLIGHCFRMRKHSTPGERAWRRN